MKILLPLIFVLSLALGSCENDHHGPDGGLHVHVAPHGGMLLELGEHGSGHNLELFLHDQGFLQVYVLDAHAEEFVRIEQPTIEILATDANGSSKTFVCDAIADPITGESVGDSSLFTSTERISDRLPLKGTIPSLVILGKFYENVSFEFKGNPPGHEDEH